MELVMDRIAAIRIENDYEKAFEVGVPFDQGVLSTRCG